MIEYLQVRLSEPCVRGALNATHRSYIFLQEAAGVSEKLTGSALYDVSKKRSCWQLRCWGTLTGKLRDFQHILLAAFEDNVISTDVPVFWRAMSWWLFFLRPLKIMLFLRMSLYFGVQCHGGSCFSPGLHFGSTITVVLLRLM